MSLQILPWSELMQLHMDQEVNYIGISLAYARLIGQKDPRHKSHVDERINYQIRRDLGISLTNPGPHINAILTKVTREWPGDLFVDVENEVIGRAHDAEEENYLEILCSECAIFWTFILAYFDRASIMEYFEGCNRDTRIFVRELLYLLCVRLDETFVDHLGGVVNDIYYANRHIFLLDSHPAPAAQAEPAAKRPHMETNGHQPDTQPDNQPETDRDKLIAFLKRDHVSFIPAKLLAYHDVTTELRSLVLWIPYLLAHWDDLGLDSFAKMYNKITYLQPEFNPRIPIGLYLYLCFFSPAHVTMLYKRVRAHARQIREERPTKWSLLNLDS